MLWPTITIRSEAGSDLSGSNLWRTSSRLLLSKEDEKGRIKVSRPRP